MGDNRYSCRLDFIFPLHIVSNVIYVIRNPLHEHAHKKVNLKPCHISIYNMLIEDTWGICMNCN